MPNTPQCSETHGFQRDPPLGLPRPEQDHFSKFPHKRKQIGKSANCPCVWCCVRVPGCSWPRPGTARICSTWRSNHESAARVHRDVAPPCAPMISGWSAAVDVPVRHCGRYRIEYNLVVPKTYYFEAFYACYKNGSRAQVEARLSPICFRFVCGLFFPSVLIILQVRNCGSQLHSGFGFLSGVLCDRAISLPDFWHLEAISCSFRCRISRSLFDSQVSDELNFHRQRASCGAPSVSRSTLKRSGVMSCLCRSRSSFVSTPS